MKSTTLSLVKQVLERQPSTREFDNTLVFAVWTIELLNKYGKNANNMTLQEIDSYHEKGLVSTYETICRLARLTKKAYPELKGKRKRKDKETVKIELKELVYKENLFA